MKNLMENRGFEIARFKQSVHIGIAAEVQWLLCDYSTVNELAGKRPLWAVNASFLKLPDVIKGSKEWFDIPKFSRNQ